MKQVTQEKLMEFSDMIDEFLSKIKTISSDLESFGYEEERCYYGLDADVRDADKSLNMLDYKRGLLMISSTLNSANILIKESKKELDSLISKSMDDVYDFGESEDADKVELEDDVEIEEVDEVNDGDGIEEEDLEDELDGEFYPVLEVRTPNGNVFYDNYSVDTFCRVISYIGPKNVYGLKIFIGNLPLVNRNNTDKKYKSIGDGWFVHTNSSTARKKQLLLQIFDELDLDYKVRLVQPR